MSILELSKGEREREIEGRTHRPPSSNSPSGKLEARRRLLRPSQSLLLRRAGGDLEA